MTLVNHNRESVKQVKIIQKALFLFGVKVFSVDNLLQSNLLTLCVM